MLKFIKKALNYLHREIILYFLWWISSYFPLFPTFMFERGRSFIWKLIGVKIGKNVKISYGVYLDVPSAKRLTIGDNCIISPECLILLHKRDISKYNSSTLQNRLPMKELKVVFENNSSIGTRTTVLPGVTIKEGSVVGAGSLLTRDTEKFSVYAGVPAKLIKTIE